MPGQHWSLFLLVQETGRSLIRFTEPSCLFAWGVLRRANLGHTLGDVLEFFSGSNCACSELAQRVWAWLDRELHLRMANLSRNGRRLAVSVVATLAVSAGLMAAAPGANAVSIKDTVKGMPGKVSATKTVQMSHCDPCGPGGVKIGVNPITGGALTGCWKPWILGKPISVKRSMAKKYKKTAQRVTVQRVRAVSWNTAPGTWEYYSDPAVTKKIPHKKKSVKFPRWGGVYSTPFGHYAVFYQITWRTAKGKFIGQRMTAANKFSCETQFGCKSKGSIVFLDTPWR